MAYITISFNDKLNDSLQVGDIVYFENNNSIAELGECIDIAEDRKSLVADIPDTNIRPAADSFFMFAKNNVINTSGLIGYHASVTLENNSTDFTELFAVNSEVNISSN